MQHVRVAADRWNFEYAENGGYVTPIGGNMLNDEHPGQATLFSHFDEKECDFRFGLMASIGLNCLRQAIGVNQVYDVKTGLKAEGVKNWDKFIKLAEKHGVYLMPVGGYLGGNDWFDVEILADSGKPLDDMCEFWKKFVGHYAGHPAIWAWDLRNELLYWNRAHMTTPGSPDELRVDTKIKTEWPMWLETKYGSVATMNKIYAAQGESFNSFKNVPGHVEFVETPYNLREFDFRNYLNDKGYAWCKRQCDAIRGVSPNHMICSGNNTWLSPDQNLFLANGFHNRAVHDLFDFVTHHPYPACQAVPNGRGDPLDGGEPLKYWLNACIGMSRFDYYGKPMVIQEYGWYGGGNSRFLCELPFRSQKEHADYTEKLVEALAPHSNGFVNWPTMDMPASNDISNHGGIFTADGKPKELAKVYRKMVETMQGKRLVRKPATTTLTYSLLALYTSRPYQDKMWDEVHATIEGGQTPDFRFI